MHKGTYMPSCWCKFHGHFFFFLFFFFGPWVPLLLLHYHHHPPASSHLDYFSLWKGRMWVEEPIPALITVEDEHWVFPKILLMAVASAEGGLCMSDIEREAGGVWESEMNKVEPDLCPWPGSDEWNGLLPSIPCFVFQTIMEQFNPCLRNFVAMGKNYEKALASKSCFSHLFSLCTAGLGTQPSQHSLSIFLPHPLSCHTVSTFLSLPY